MYNAIYISHIYRKYKYVCVTCHKLMRHSINENEVMGDKKK